MEPNKTNDDVKRVGKFRLIAVLLGPMLAAVAYSIAPEAYESNGTSVVFSSAARATLALMVWMSVWWLSEATNITTTALIPIALFPLFGVASVEEATAPYADPIVFLFMGGFLLALSMQRWGLGKRIAIMTLLLVGTRPRAVVAGFMLITAVFSAFVSNVATVAMMFPIALSVIRLLSVGSGDANAETEDHVSSGETASLATCLLLSIAYASSIGGISTIIGTAPNAFLVGYLRDNLPEQMRVDISFVGWMRFAAPIAACLLVATWALLTFVLFRMPRTLPGFTNLVLKGWLKEIGPIRRGEWATMVVFVVTVVLWLIRPQLAAINLGSAVEPWFPFRLISDTGIVMVTAILLFLIPAGWSSTGQRQFVMDWETAKQLPWNVLLLFGGGLSLAAAVKRNGVTEFLGSQLVFLSGKPEWLVVLVVTTVVVFMTELTSNTATTASLVPVLAALAVVVGIHPLILVVAAGISASCAFMLPVATPPNAIVYGSGCISMPQMARSGFLLNLISIAVITFFVLKFSGILLEPATR